MRKHGKAYAFSGSRQVSKLISSLVENSTTTTFYTNNLLDYSWSTESAGTTATYFDQSNEGRSMRLPFPDKYSIYFNFPCTVYTLTAIVRTFYCQLVSHYSNLQCTILLYYSIQYNTISSLYNTFKNIINHIMYM